ncbi:MULTISPECIES: MlaD family protein [Mycobacterium]|uniref:Mammalian cell entry protein n=1 Tax=Mycobacterium terramassiliense TaxID=1841859 RepID=A0A2U3NG65_9MYCO|nr:MULTISPECIES: MlaD family protein [Mycobacterium]MCV7090968.1 MCE family protein [Mycobacterium interjectum]ORV86932.1 mammalian cell entry protein [Mycobacterium interjectum]SPM30413.1 mammalian cell entry protein [Mycobacterium terramassiliense]
MTRAVAGLADVVVRVVRAGHRQQIWLSVAGLVLTLIVATAYLLVGGLRVTPFASSYRVTVQLPESGGLLPHQDVSLRGVRIGRVESLQITGRGVDAVANITSSVRIPASSVAHVSALSPAGEQYINFEAESDAGPYLHDGSVLALDRTSVPVSLAQLLGDADGMLAQVDPHKVESIKKELSLSKEGPGKLAAIIDGGTFLLSTLDSVLPQTTSILKTSRIVLTLASDKNAGLAATTTELNRTLAGVAGMQSGYRRLTGQTPQTLSAVDNLFADNSDTMVQLLGSMATMSQLLYLRVPALNALFPDYRGSVLDAMASSFHDHGVWATASLYPRYVCDYGTPSHPPSSADYYEPFMYTYCRDDDPGVGIRAAKNAPRPGGDDTAGPPPGADLGRRTDPTPRGRFTIPTPYGGPALPIEPPH